MNSFFFDLDGTLGDTLPLCIAAFREAIEPLAGKRLSDAEIVAEFGPSEEGTIAALLPGMEDEGVDAYIQFYETFHDRWPDPFDGILEVLDYLKSTGAFVGLVTGKGSRSTALTLGRYGLDGFFDVVKTGASSGPVKDIRIEEIIEEFSLNREKILYVGDTPTDITAAWDCRIKVAAAAWASTADRKTMESMAPDYLFKSIPEFFDFIKNICSS